MQLRTKQSEGKLRRGWRLETTSHRQRPDGRRQPDGETLERRRSRRQGGAPEDLATYNCQCGMVFEAAVSTAVSCPHCGQGQAW